MTGGGQLFPAIDAGAVPWLSVDQMREVDRIMVEELGVSLVRMMENAGRSLAQLARDLLGGDTQRRSILVLAGPGGNGGGGLVAARHLAAAGADVAVAVSAPDERFAPVPAEQLAIARRLAIPIHEQVDSVGEPELVLDALLGYSQQGEPHGRAAELIRWSAGRRVLALDVPSGLELASGKLHTAHVIAEATMTLAAPKTALAEAAEAVGRLLLALLVAPARSRAEARATSLRGTVGPGFTITLKTTEGKLVKKLKAGTYTIRIRDLSPIHNFHLFGPGVNKKTSVQDTGSVTWTVRLGQGLYRYRCDPHRTIMHGRFTVS